MYVAVVVHLFNVYMYLFMSVYIVFMYMYNMYIHPSCVQASSHLQLRSRHVVFLESQRKCQGLCIAQSCETAAHTCASGEKPGVLASGFALRIT